MPGTTRDTIDTVVETDDGPIRFVDTAGLRKRVGKASGTEYYASLRTAGAIEAAVDPIWAADPQEWWAVVESNLRGAFNCVRAVVPGMVARGGGRVVDRWVRGFLGRKSSGQRLAAGDR